MWMLPWTPATMIVSVVYKLVSANVLTNNWYLNIVLDRCCGIYVKAKCKFYKANGEISFEWYDGVYFG